MFRSIPMQWYYGENGQQLGPVDENQFQALIASGRIGAATMVWKEGMSNWMPLSQVQVSGMLAGQVGAYQVPGPYSMMSPPTSGLAIASLICGIAGLVTCMLLPGIPAVICGHMAMNQIANSPLPMVGRGMAISGLVCGYLSVLVMLSFAVVMMVAIISGP